MAEIRTGKVTECKATGFDPDSHGNKWYNVKFEDGTEGLYLGKKPEHFEVAKTVSYTLEKKTSKSNKEYNKIGLPQKDNEGRSGGGSYEKKFDPVKQYRIANTVALKVAVKVKRIASFDVTGKISEVFLAFIMKQWQNEGNMIAAQSALDLAAEALQDINTKYASMDEFMARTEAFYQRIITPLPESKEEQK